MVKAIDEEYSRSHESGDVEKNANAQNKVVPQANHLNSLFNGHLMKWKYEAEEGSSFVRIPAFLGALILVAACIVTFVTNPDSWTTHSIIMSVCIITLAMFVVVLDSRFLARDPLSTRAQLRNIATRNFNIFRFLWGRGLLYVAAGTLCVAQSFWAHVYAGAFMIAVGLMAIMVGVYSSRKFAALRNSLADEGFLLLVFSNNDSDGDGCITPSEFAALLVDLGMELDDRYTLKAFHSIDSDDDRRISFEEFSQWWASGFIERGRKKVSGSQRSSDHHRANKDDEDSYHRM